MQPGAVIMMTHKVAGGGKRARPVKESEMDKSETLAKHVRAIRAQISTIMTEPSVAGDEMSKGFVEGINQFLGEVDKNPNYFNEVVKGLPANRLMDAAQVIGMKNFEHMLRHLNKAVWHDQLMAVTARIETLTLFKFNIFRDVTMIGYSAANMSDTGIYDHFQFGKMITNVIGERAFAAGRESAAGR